MTHREYGREVGRAALEKTAAKNQLARPASIPQRRGTPPVALTQQQLQDWQDKLDAKERKFENLVEARQKSHNRATSALRDSAQLQRTQIGLARDIENASHKAGFSDVRAYLKDLEEKAKKAARADELEEQIKNSKVLDFGFLKKIRPKHVAIGGGAALVGGAGLYGLHRLMKNDDEYAFLDR